MQGSYKWINILDALISEYNKTKHRTIKMAPNDLNLGNELLLRTVFNRPPIWSRNKFIGDIVRISKYKAVFDKGYSPNFRNELFKVIGANQRFPVTYKLEDMKHTPISGQFYETELLKTKYLRIIKLNR